MSGAGDTPRRVTFLVMSTHLGGAATSFALLLRALAGRGIERRVVLLGEPWPGQLRDRVASTCESIVELPVPALYHDVGYWLSPRRWRRILRQSATGTRAVVEELRRHPPDLVHVNTTAYSHLLGPVKAALPGTPLAVHAREVMRARSPDDPVALWARGETARHADLLIAISQNELAPFPGHPRAEILPNPVDVTAAAATPPGGLRARLALDAATPLVGMIASFLPMKGHLDFLRAAHMVVRSNPSRPVHFALIGFPDRPPWRRRLSRVLARLSLSYSGRVERAVQELGLAGRVSLVPFTDRPLEALRDLDVVVRPSLAGDPWGRDVIEALACGRAVVATGSSPVYVREGETGFLVPPGAHGAMAERIGRLLDDPPLREQLGGRGQELVRELCDLSGYGDRLLGLYARLLRSRGGVG